jgi:hypothetical protein
MGFDPGTFAQTTTMPHTQGSVLAGNSAIKGVLQYIIPVCPMTLWKMINSDKNSMPLCTSKCILLSVSLSHCFMQAFVQVLLLAMLIFYGLAIS